MHRLLILNCSRYKRATPEPLPAIERYDGPKYQVLRAWLATLPPGTEPPVILILSAKYGLISGSDLIPYYDQRMTEERAWQLRSSVLHAFRERVSGERFTDVFVLLSHDYLIALDGFEKYLPKDAKITLARGPDHVKEGRLRKWLSRGVTPPRSGEATPSR